MHTSSRKGFKLGTISTREIAQAVLAGSAALASLLLVFAGFLVTRAESIPAEVENRIARRYRLAAKLGLVPVVGCTVVMLASYGWLFNPTSNHLFYLWSVRFVVVSVVFVLYAVISILLI